MTLQVTTYQRSHVHHPRWDDPSAVVWCLDCAAGLVVSSTTEVQQLQRFCRHSCCRFVVPRTSGHRLTAEIDMCCPRTISTELTIKLSTISHFSRADTECTVCLKTWSEHQLCGRFSSGWWLIAASRSTFTLVLTVMLLHVPLEIVGDWLSD